MCFTAGRLASLEPAQLTMAGDFCFSYCRIARFMYAKLLAHLCFVVVASLLALQGRQQVSRAVETRYFSGPLALGYTLDCPGALLGLA